MLSMDDVIWKIYNNIVREDRAAVELVKKTDDEISKELACYKNVLSVEEYERLKDLLYRTVDCGRQEGFRLGMRYAYKIALSSFENGL
jgi:hypothetical protein